MGKTVSAKIFGEMGIDIFKYLRNCQTCVNFNIYNVRRLVARDKLHLEPILRKEFPSLVEVWTSSRGNQKTDLSPFADFIYNKFGK